MSAIVYLNGDFVPRAEARIDIEDRGFMFADGVYEVIRYFAGEPLEMPAHVERLRRSLAAIALPPPTEFEQLPRLSVELLQRNGLTDARMYWQITRGCAPRSHAMARPIAPTVLLMAAVEPPLQAQQPIAALSAITTPDLRWDRCDIKSLMLLPNVMARQQAFDAGADEAIMHRHGVVTEGAATTAFAVLDSCLRTHPENQHILPGITRDIVLKVARRAGLQVSETAFSLTELSTADELILTGSTTNVAAVVTVDGRIVGEGTPGPISCRLHALFQDYVIATCGLSR